MSSSLKKTRFMIISDTHTKDPISANDPNAGQYGFKEPFPEADVLLHCGDLTMFGLLDEFDKVISMLSKIKAELKLVIAGNHDCSLDRQYFRRMGEDQHGDAYNEETPQRAIDMWKGKLAKEAGITYLEEGTYEFTLKSGATFSIYASPYQPEFCDWAFPYEKYEDRFNTPEQSLTDATNISQNPIQNHIDVVMTHGPAYKCHDKTFDGLPVGCPHLLRALMRTRPLLHCCGHIHEAHGASRITWPEDASERAVDRMSMSQWRDTGLRRAEIVKANTGHVDDRKARQPVFIDCSQPGSEPLRREKDTLMVNAAIVDLYYRPIYAPYLVDLELQAKP
ncbi:MAG: hypothetical protein M1820_004515 [Bogoriella megaspora]|nr:MAG: hypothetical protein M1820_004515 [Bogoriella megaspora]